jgi:hypothetical protein
MRAFDAGEAAKLQRLKGIISAGQTSARPFSNGAPSVKAMQANGLDCSATPPAAVFAAGLRGITMTHGFLAETWFDLTRC